MGIQYFNQEIGARILSVLVAFAMIAGATLVVLPYGNEGALTESPIPFNIAGTNIVISEVAAAGSNSAYDEFVELYNPTSSAIDISGWTLEYASSTGTWPGTTRGTVPADTIIPAKSFYLFANYYTGGTTPGGYVVPTSGPEPDVWMNFNGMANTGGKVRIMNGTEQVDCFGWGSTTLYAEGTPNLISWGTIKLHSAERKAFTDSLAGNGDTGMEAGGGHEFFGNGFDSDDNAYDFITRTTRQPQNSDSQAEGGTDTTPPDFRYAISTSPTAIEVRFNEPVNQADAETLSKWNIVSLTGFDTVPPYIVNCMATSTTSVEVTFSEPVNTADANSINNYYEINYGLAITNAVLDAELTTVNLTTGVQVVDRTYTLQISWINDTANPPNVIQENSETTFNGGGGGGILKVIFMDVEQSDSTIVISPTGQTLLYDGGFTNMGNRIVDTLTANGVSTLKYTVASHYHEDHIGGMDEVITGLGGISHVTGACFDRGSSYSSSIFDEYLSVVSSKRMTITKGMVLDLGGGATATCVGVNGNGLTVSDENDFGVVMRVDYQDFQMYLGGDLGGYNDGGYKDVESTVANDVGKVEVYQVDHHGSKYSSNSYFLGVLDPLVSVFSVGNNGYGHVHPEAFNRILSQGSFMYYTNTGSGSVPTSAQGTVVNGNILLTTSGKSFEIAGDLYQCHDQADITAPTIIDVRATDLTHVELTFSEPINLADAETESNYVFTGGIGTNPSLAILKPDLRTVNLTTGVQTVGATYSITINNIRDRATPANTIMANTYVQFTGGKPTLSITSVEIDPNDHSIVYLTTGVQSRIGYALYAYNIRDEAGNNKPESTANFIGGGYHMTINQIYYDPASTNDDNLEWWEIHNPETNSINLKSWKFADDGNTFGLPAYDLLMLQDQYASFAINGQTFYETYGYYPDFEVFGDTVAKTMSYTGTSRQPLGNTADFLEMSNSYGKVYDAVVWGNKVYGSMTGYTAPDVAAGTSLARIIPGREGPEDVLASSPTGADEQSEKQNSGVFMARTNPVPQTLDCQPPTIGEIQTVAGSVFATISWQTTEPGWPEINPQADSKIVYSANSNPDAGANMTSYSSTMGTEHALTLYPLTPDTDYYFYISATDGKGQTNTDKNGGTFYHFRTATQDTTPPVISNIQVIAHDTTALITWTTDELSSSTVYYGKNAPPGQVQTNLHLTTEHSMLLYGLETSTEYLFSVVSMNPSGLVSIDDNSGSYYTFLTTAPVALNYYTGSMDAFTSYSSGTGTPEEAYAYANGGAGSTTNHLVISEIFYNQVSTDSAALCFVELYNPTSSPITFTAGDPWYINHVDGNTDSTLKTHTLNTGTIPAYGFFLVGGASVSPTPDIVDGYDYQNGPDTIRLEHPNGVFIDVVGYEGSGSRAAWTEGDNYETSPVPIPTEGYSIERRSGSPHDDAAGNQLDTNDNSQDFYARATPQPQNSASAIEMPPAGQGPDINVLGINDYSYLLSGAEYAAGKSQQTASTINGDFIALYGQQLWDGSEGYGKISVYDENANDIASGLALYNLDSAFQWVIDHEAIGIFNSPGIGTFEEMRYNSSADQYMLAFELLDSSNGSPYEHYYNKGLNNGWRYGALAGQRNENGNWGNKVNAYSKIDMTMFRAPSLTQAEILESLRTMNFYAFEADTILPPSSDPVVHDLIHLDFSVNGYCMGQEFTDTNPLDFTVTLSATNTFHTIELIEDGSVVRTWSGTPTDSLIWEFTHTPSQGHHYYYVRGNQSDGQKSRFWSSPIWVHNPALSLPNEAPKIHTVTHTPSSPMGTDDVVITAKAIDPENAISKVQLWHSQNSAPYQNVLMRDDGLFPDAVAGDGVYSAILSAMPVGTNIHYYASVIDDAGLQATSPVDAPVHFYSFYVGPRVLISEVYCNAHDQVPTVGSEESEFIEFYNPSGGSVDMAGWTIEAQRSSGVWAFPLGVSTLVNGGYFVLARDSYYDSGAGGYRGDPQLVASPNRAIPDFEMFDGDDLYDDTQSHNMVLAGGTNKEIKLNNYDDTLILRNHLGTIMDSMEYGIDYSWIPGKPAYVSPENCSLTRDINSMDTDDSMVDFTSTKAPTPGRAVGSVPVIHNVVASPGSPEATETVAVSARITCSGGITATVRYRVNGGAFQTPVTMTNMGNNIFTGTLPAQAASSSVEYYVYAASGPLWDSNPVDDPSDGETAVPPERLYSYTVWPHLVISEVYYNTNVHVSPALNSKFIEIYNPTSSQADISDWELHGEPTWYARKWKFPAGTLIAPGQALVIAKTAGDAATSGFFTEFGFYPDFEMYDATCASSGYSDHDNPSVANMILMSDDNYDDQIELPGYPYYDAIYLYDASVPKLLVDAMEYGIEGENVNGMPATETDVGYSLTRDDMATDTDNSLFDFHADLPSPGVLGVELAIYNISLQPAPGWNFISFPLGVSGPVLSVLDDMGGTTDWDVVKWYDPSDRLWKTYRKDGVSNTLAIVGNTMGLWVHITVVGDGYLSVEGPVPTTTSISLRAGWNLVSYPSMTPRQASATLPGVANIVSVYQAAAPYVNDITDLSTVTMSAGNAYWVHCTADAVWVVGY